MLLSSLWGNILGNNGLIHNQSSINQYQYIYKNKDLQLRFCHLACLEFDMLRSFFLLFKKIKMKIKIKKKLR
jgi:hypothetical protein